MDAQFWHDRWQQREIGFHREHINPHLIKYFPTLELQREQVVLLPLCGKTRDITYFLQQGLQVVGAELSEIAVKELFLENEMQAEVTEVDEMLCYQAEGLRVFVGDFFKLRKHHIGAVDAIYDRAALVALPLELRRAYTKHLIDLSDSAPQLLITYEYDQSIIDGPPFSVSRQEVELHYASFYDINALYTDEVEGGMKGKTSASETVYCLR
jgi:thiopurine S-methyltransferase